jgi:hypothetical protein
MEYQQFDADARLGFQLLMYCFNSPKEIKRMPNQFENNMKSMEAELELNINGEVS